MSEPKNGRNGNAFRVLKPVYVTYQNYAATIELGAKSASHETLTAACRQVTKLIPTAKAEAKVNAHGYVIQLQMSGGSTDSGFDKVTREKLAELVQPQYTARATASADVIRDSGYHKGTIVTLTVADGASRVLDEDEINALPGVLLAKVTDDGHTIMFSLANPVTDKAGITKAVSPVAETLGLHFTRPVEVYDPEPQYALLPEYAYKAPADNTA